jgi:hypothetical protein
MQLCAVKGDIKANPPSGGLAAAKFPITAASPICPEAEACSLVESCAKLKFGLFAFSKILF